MQSQLLFRTLPLVLAILSSGATTRAQTNVVLDACAGPRFAYPDVNGYDPCETPRTDSLSGGFVALDIGVISYTRAARERARIGSGPAVGFRFGIELWDRLVTSLSLGGLSAGDRDPYSEDVIYCDTIEGVVVNCDDSPTSKESTISMPFFMSLETGYQVRFRPGAGWSLTSGLLAGYLHTFAKMSRAVECDGCRGGTDLDVRAKGAYAAPMLRVTFGRTGFWGVALRSQWFLTGDIAQMTTLGAELGMP